MIRSCMKPASIGLLPLFETTAIAFYGLSWKYMEINGKKSLLQKKIADFNVFSICCAIIWLKLNISAKIMNLGSLYNEMLILQADGL